KIRAVMDSSLAAVPLPLPQHPASEMLLLVRSPLPPKDIAPALLRTLSQLQPSLPIALRTWPEALRPVLFPARAATAALGLLGLFAVMLAVTGIFGMAAHRVSRRLRELGIRPALGARPAPLLPPAARPAPRPP